MTVAYMLPDSNVVRLVLKGAPEVVVPRCTHELDADNTPTEFSEEQVNDYLSSVITTSIAQKG